MGEEEEEERRPEGRSLASVRPSYLPWRYYRNPAPRYPRVNRQLIVGGPVG
jgi:hypothetical protein